MLPLFDYWFIIVERYRSRSLQQLLTGFHFVNHHGGFLGETGTCPSCSWLDCSCRGSARVYRRSRQAMPDRQRRVERKATEALKGNRWLSLPYRFLIDLRWRNYEINSEQGVKKTRLVWKFGGVGVKKHGFFHSFFVVISIFCIFAAWLHWERCR